VSMTNPTNHVEIVTSVQRRRRWTASEKVRMFEETFEPGMTVSLVARRHGVAPNQPVPGWPDRVRAPQRGLASDGAGLGAILIKSRLAPPVAAAWQEPAFSLRPADQMTARCHRQARLIHLPISTIRADQNPVLVTAATLHGVVFLKTELFYQDSSCFRPFRKFCFRAR
jgi:Transposase